MWNYQQRNAHGDGELDKDGAFEAISYSGTGDGRNNPDMEAVPNVGPIPKGLYRIGPATDDHPHLGPRAIPLIPVDHDAHGRTDFFAHGDSKTHDASHGCIILGRTMRDTMDASSDKDLMVI